MSIKNIKTWRIILFVVCTAFAINVLFSKMKVKSMLSQIASAETQEQETKLEMKAIMDKYEIEKLQRVENMTIKIMETQEFLNRLRSDKDSLLDELTIKPDYLLNPYDHFIVEYDQTMGRAIVKKIVEDNGDTVIPE